jgi:hypothetical protein
LNGWGTAQSGRGLMSEATTSKSKTFYAQRKTTRTREKYFGAAETEPKALETEAENMSARKDGTGAGPLTKTTEPDCWTRTRLRSKKYKRTGAGHGMGKNLQRIWRAAQPEKNKSEPEKMLEAAQNRKQHTA